MILLQAITQDWAVSANWAFVALIGVLATMANVLLYRVLNRIESKLERHDEEIGDLKTVTSNHSIQLAAQERVSNDWAKTHTEMANMVIAKIRLLKEL